MFTLENDYIFNIAPDVWIIAQRLSIIKTFYQRRPYITLYLNIAIISICLINIQYTLTQQNVTRTDLRITEAIDSHTMYTTNMNDKS